jgi:hypothetical protein
MLVLRSILACIPASSEQLDLKMHLACFFCVGWQMERKGNQAIAFDAALCGALWLMPLLRLLLR